VEGDARGFRVAVCADVLVNPESGGLDALAVCARAGFGVMQLPATWYPEEVAAGWLEQVAEQLDEYLRHGYAVVLVTRAGDADGPRQRTALAAALAAIGHGLPPEHESDGDADALEEFLRAQPVPGATA
jgi:DNA-binding transcriptional LysR family regulator